MSRPSRNTDKLLIKAGRKLLPLYGVSGLNIRMVAAKANVNLGMFHYYFKTKDEFVKLVLQEIYEEFFKEFNLESSAHATPLENLKSCVRAIARFINHNRPLLASLVKDAINGEQSIRDFARMNFLRHLRIIMELIKKSQKDGSICGGGLPNIIAPIMGAVAGPILVSEILSRSGDQGIIDKVFLKSIVSGLITDEAIEHRVDIIFEGLVHCGKK